MLNSKYFPRDEYFRHHSLEQEEENEHLPVNEMKRRPHLQVRGLCYHYRRPPPNSLHLLDNISIEARPGDILGVLATTRNEPSVNHIDLFLNSRLFWPSLALRPFIY